MIIERTESETWLSNAYLVADREGGRGVVIDGNGVVGPLIEAAGRLGVTVEAILVTHHHGDHLAGLDEYRAAFPDAQVIAHPWTAGEGGVEGVVDRVLEETGGFGADYTFEATGNVGVMRQAVESARMGWGVCCVTGVAGKGETLDIVPRYLITGRKVMGASFGGVKGREQVPQLVDRYLAGDVDVDSFLSHRIPLDEVNRGFELMHHQDGIRSVIQFP